MELQAPSAAPREHEPEPGTVAIMSAVGRPRSTSLDWSTRDVLIKYLPEGTHQPVNRTSNQVSASSRSGFIFLINFRTLYVTMTGRCLLHGSGRPVILTWGWLRYLARKSIGLRRPDGVIRSHFENQAALSQSTDRSADCANRIAGLVGNRRLRRKHLATAVAELGQLKQNVSICRIQAKLLEGPIQIAPI